MQKTRKISSLTKRKPQQKLKIFQISSVNSKQKSSRNKICDQRRILNLKKKLNVKNKTKRRPNR